MCRCHARRSFWRSLEIKARWFSGWETCRSCVWPNFQHWMHMCISLELTAIDRTSSLESVNEIDNILQFYRFIRVPCACPSPMYDKSIKLRALSRMRAFTMFSIHWTCSRRSNALRKKLHKRAAEWVKMSLNFFPPSALQQRLVRSISLARSLFFRALETPALALARELSRREKEFIFQ